MKQKNIKNNFKHPFVFLCTGMSLDGKISSAGRVCTRITSDDDRSFLYDMRVFCDAVMAGGKTIILDDSALNVKTEKRQKKRLAMGKTIEPVKVGIVSDISELKEDGDFLNKGVGKIIIFTTKKSSSEKIRALRKKANIYVYGEKE